MTFFIPNLLFSFANGKELKLVCVLFQKIARDHEKIYSSDVAIVWAAPISINRSQRLYHALATPLYKRSSSRDPLIMI